MREKEDNIRRATKKLIATSKDLSETEPSESNRTNEQGAIEKRVTGDFSATDLIRQNIADPNVFDEQLPPSDDDEMVVATPQPAESHSSTLADFTSTWTLNSAYWKIPPARYPNKAQGSVGRVESVTEEGCATPQCSSTPNQNK